MLVRLLGAVQFLTVLPVSGRTASPAGSAMFFPLVGAALGWAGACLYLLVVSAWPAPLAALLVVAFWMMITGALHEDGLADVADAFRAGRTRDRILSILKDSRIGSYGGAALVLSVAFRWQAVTHMSQPVILRLAAALALSRAVLVATAWISRPAGSGLGAAFLQSMTTSVAVFAIAQGVVAALLCGPRMGLLLMTVNLALVVFAREYFHRHIGGVTGDCLGATCQVSEIASLFLMTCQNCSW